MQDINNHVIKKRTSYLSVSRYEKKPNSEFSKNKHIINKQSNVRGPVYVLSTQMMSPQVHVTFNVTDIHLQNSEYQWLCDSIGQL